MDAQVAPLKCIFNEGRCDSDFDCAIRFGSGAQCMPVNGTTQFKCCCINNLPPPRPSDD